MYKLIQKDEGTIKALLHEMAETQSLKDWEGREYVAAM
jgi:hypothetical protein